MELELEKKLPELEEKKFEELEKKTAPVMLN